MIQEEFGKKMWQVLRETFSHEFEKIVENLTHCTVLSCHSDINTKMGERIEVFIVDKNLEKVLEE
jgi:uncharacterized protein YbcI